MIGAAYARRHYALDIGWPLLPRAQERYHYELSVTLRRCYGAVDTSYKMPMPNTPRRQIRRCYCLYAGCRHCYATLRALCLRQRDGAAAAAELLPLHSVAADAMLLDIVARLRWGYYEMPRCRAHAMPMPPR